MHAFTYAAITGVVTFVAVAGLIHVVCKQAWRAGKLYQRMGEDGEDERLEQMSRRLLENARHRK